MKNTIDLTDGRVFRDKPEEKHNPLWSNYGTRFPLYHNSKPVNVKKEDYGFEYNASDDTLYFRSIVNSELDEWTKYNIIDSYLNYMYLTSSSQSANYTINTNRINSTDIRHKRRNRIQFVYNENQLGEWINIQWNLDLQNKNDVSNVLQVLKAKRFISDFFKTPIKDKRYDLFYVTSFEKKYRTLEGCMRCDFYVPDLDKHMNSGYSEYPFQTPEYTSDNERTVPLLFERRRPTISDLWKNYKRGEKNPLNSWNLDPDFLDEEIEMPRDSTFMDLKGRPEDVIRGIN